MKIHNINIKIFITGLIINLFLFAVVNGQQFIQNQELTGLLPDVYNGDVLWGDYDADGDLDILLSGNTADSLFTGIYRNNGSIFNALNLNLVTLYNSNMSWCDFDNDGDLDFLLIGTEIIDTINWPSAILYENTGDDNFEVYDAGISGVLDGRSAWGDLDNDGDQDLVMIGDKGNIGVTRIYSNLDGSTFEFVDHNLLNIYNGDIALGDYDNDRDLDILLIGVVVNSDKTEEKVLNLYRNEGDFNFLSVYSGFVGMSESCLQWADYDSDGSLDIIANGSTEAPTHLVYLYQNLKNDNFLNIGIEIFGTVNGSVSWGDYNVDGDFDFLLTGLPSYGSDPITVIYRNIDINLFNKDDSVILVDVHQSQARWGDYDNDGDLDILMSGLQSQNNNPITTVYLNNNEVANSPPSIPGNLQSSVSDNSVVLSWSVSIDNETPDEGLTYSIRVGTSSGEGNIVSSMSNEFGKLLVPQLGNVNHNKSWDLKNLSPGTYFWSVQAVDNNFEGSSFAEEQSFEIITSGISNELLMVNPNQPLINSFPNPFTDRITFEIITKENSIISAYVMDLNGRIVRNFAKNRQMGKHLLIFWNGTDNQGELLDGGIYHLFVESDNFRKSKKVILMN